MSERTAIRIAAERIAAPAGGVASQSPAAVAAVTTGDAFARPAAAASRRPCARPCGPTTSTWSSEARTAAGTGATSSVPPPSAAIAGRARARSPSGPAALPGDEQAAGGQEREGQLHELRERRPRRGPSPPASAPGGGGRRPASRPGGRHGDAVGDPGGRHRDLEEGRLLGDRVDEEGALRRAGPGRAGAPGSRRPDPRSRKPPHAGRAEERHRREAVERGGPSTAAPGSRIDGQVDRRGPGQEEAEVAEHRRHARRGGSAPRPSAAQPASNRDGRVGEERGQRDGSAGSGARSRKGTLRRVVRVPCDADRAAPGR